LPPGPRSRRERNCGCPQRGRIHLDGGPIIEVYSHVRALADRANLGEPRRGDAALELRIEHISSIVEERRPARGPGFISRLQKGRDRRRLLRVPMPVLGRGMRKSWFAKFNEIVRG
jgi:hypothetical protein